jgi:hypothetical protein
MPNPENFDRCEWMSSETLVPQLSACGCCGRNVSSEKGYHKYSQEQKQVERASNKMLFGRWRILFFHKPLLRVARIDPDQTRIKMSRVFYDIHFFWRKFLGAGFAGGCLTPLLSERSEIGG